MFQPFRAVVQRLTVFLNVYVQKYRVLDQLRHQSQLHIYSLYLAHLYVLIDENQSEFTHFVFIFKGDLAKKKIYPTLWFVN